MMRPSVGAPRARIHSAPATAIVLASGYGVFAAATLITGAALLQAFGPGHLPLPALFSDDQVRTSITTFSSLFFALGVISLATEPAAQLALTAPRGWATTQLARVGGGMAVAVAVVWLTAPEGYAAKTVSGVLALGAEGLFVARVAGVRLGWTLPVAHLLAAVVFGARDNEGAQPWAWFVGTHIPAAALYLPATALALCAVWWARGFPLAEDDELLG